MCGIVGYIGNQRAAKILFQGLKRLEYRGYDSAGISVIKENKILTYKNKGKISDLLNSIENIRVEGNIGIGHTRWATHGKPSNENSHPHLSCDNEFAVVHNGIIENYQELKAELIEKNHKFSSETDTEVLAHLIEENYDANLEKTIIKLIPKIRGTYAVAVISLKENDADKIVCFRKGSPLIIGLGKNENFIASDIPAVLPYTKDIIFLDDKEIAILKKNEVKVVDFNNEIQNKAVNAISWDVMMSEKKEYKHYMLKEIYEQPKVIIDTIEDKIDKLNKKIEFKDVEFDENYLKNINKIYVVACGTAWHAGLVGKYLFEEFCGLNVETAIASEFRYRKIPLTQDDIVIAVSQSGETADTLAAIRKAKKCGCKTIAVCNVFGSTLAREVDNVIYTHGGHEIGVASTKAFTTQLIVFFLLSLKFGLLNKTISEEKYFEYFDELLQMPDKIEEILENFDNINEISQKFHNYYDFLFLGRHFNYPIALEGALKLKEISYIHAEGYPAGEMKHGPIALITDKMPVVMIATESYILEKIIGNLQEVKARDGITIVVMNNELKIDDNLIDYKITVPKTIEPFSPILNVIPLQILSYQIADWLGCDIDQPRNLAKSVTVE